MGEEFVSNRCREACFEPNEIEDVADIHQTEEFILGHDFAILAKASGSAREVGVPRARVRLQLLDGDGADVRQIGSVAHRIRVGLDKLGKTGEKGRVGFVMALQIWGCTIMEAKFRRMIETVHSAFDGCVGHIAYPSEDVKELVFIVLGPFRMVLFPKFWNAERHRLDNLPWQ